MNQSNASLRDINFFDMSKTLDSSVVISPNSIALEITSDVASG
jgi:hypothetical protein